VAESLAPGVNVSEIARRHEINPQQLFGWRKKFGEEAAALIESARPSAPLPAFAPVLIEGPGPNIVNPPAALFSTKKRCPIVRLSSSPTMRAATSAALPGPKPTTIRTGRSG
jgi:transposase-like protein